jgi:T4 RnlA family RNA ligase
MKVSLPIEEEYFYITPNTFCGLDCYLITPEMDAKWNNNNLFYRSLITDKEGNVLSSGWPKFFNYGEKPECYPKLEDYNDWRFVDKVDGSLVICDYINDQFSMRTRGTVSYKTLPNAKDFELLPEKYPQVVEFLKENPHLTLLFEIVTPNNVIVVRPKEIEFYLLGAINKNGMVVVSNQDLTDIWRKIGPIQMPQTYQFDNISDLAKIAQHIKNWKGKEGIVISYNNNQNRIKLKSDWYCFIHRIKSELNSTDNLINFYIDKEMPLTENFNKIIETEFDYEIAVQLKDI